jgi:Ca-activated chloride channel family protein
VFDPGTFPTGLRAAWADARQFLLAVRFAAPWALWLSLAPAALSVARWVGGRRLRGRLAAVGRPGAVAGLAARPAGGRLPGFLLFLGWTLLVVGAAGPRWGAGGEEGVAVGRDVVILLDISRSMWAADMAGRGTPERWQAAAAGATELVDAAARAGGHRVAVVLVATRPAVLVPLTTDADHLRLRLADLDARAPPAEVRPAEDAPSGTRLGAGIAAAVAAHDPRFPGYQDIVLVTDADDPAGDEEWRAGVAAARAAGIPVHVVGVGDPARDSFVLASNGEPLESVGPNGVPRQVQTRLNEAVASAIAAETGGAYLPARQGPVRLGEFFRARIEPHPTKELSDDRLPQPRDRAAWFLGPAAACFALAWLRQR